MKSKPNPYHLKSKTSQEGVTIVVALILLATIGFISFSLSTVILRGIRTGRVLQNTELALGGANSGGEVSLYRFQRNAGGLNISNSPLSSGASFTVIPDLTDDPYNFSVASPNVLTVNLYDPDNIAGNPGFRSAVITNSAGNNIRVNVYNWADMQNTVPGCSYPSIPSGQSRTCNLSAGKYQITIEINGGGAASGNVRAFDETGAPMGIPSVSPVLEVIGKMSDAQRRIRVDLLNP